MNQGHLWMVGVHSAVVKVSTEKKLSKYSQLSHVSAATEYRTYNTKVVRLQTTQVGLRAHKQ